MSSSLEERLSDSELKSEFEDVIYNAVQKAQKHVYICDKIGHRGETFDNAREFLASYRACAWKGEASSELANALSQLSIHYLMGRRKLSALPYYALFAVGSSVAVLGVVLSQPVAIFGGAAIDLLAFKLFGRYARKEIKRTSQISAAFLTHKDLLNEALKNVYELERQNEGAYRPRG